jgi:hypothetical protein
VQTGGWNGEDGTDSGVKSVKGDGLQSRSVLARADCGGNWEKEGAKGEGAKERSNKNGGKGKEGRKGLRCPRGVDE